MDASRVRDAPLCGILLRAPMPLAAVLRAGHGLLAFAVFDVVPLWAIASSEAGGLALSKEEVGTLLASAAIGQVVYTALAMGKLANRLGMRQAFVRGSVAAGAALAVTPLLPRLLYAARAPRAVAIVMTSVVYCLHTCEMCDPRERRA